MSIHKDLLDKLMEGRSTNDLLVRRAIFPS